MPPERKDCWKQSRGPRYWRGAPSGWDWRRTFIVSKGYSMSLPVMPAICCIVVGDGLVETFYFYIYIYLNCGVGG